MNTKMSSGRASVVGLTCLTHHLQLPHFCINVYSFAHLSINQRNNRNVTTEMTADAQFPNAQLCLSCKHMTWLCIWEDMFVDP